MRMDFGNITQDRFEKGVAMGLKKGIAVGVEQGILAGKKEMALKMLLKNNDDDEICECAGLTHDALAIIKNETGDN